MPTNLRLNALVSDQKTATSFSSIETAILSATQVTPDATTDSVVILVTLNNLRKD